MKRRTVLGGVCTAAAGWWTTGAQAAASAASDGDLVIGQVAPLSGVIAGTGNEYVAGAAAYFAHVNAQGGINGRRIRVAVRDDAYNPDKTLQHTREMLEKDKPLALFGFVGTGNVLALHKNKVLGDAGIALLAPYTGAMDLRDPSIGNIFHIRASYTDETARMVEHLHTIGIRRIAVMYQDDAFGKSGLAGAQAAMEKLNITPVALGHYERTAPEAVDEAAATVAAAKPEAVIMVAVNRASAAFARKLRASGSAARLFSISVVNFKELLKNAGEELVRGIGISQVMPFPYAPSTPVVREFLALMSQHAPDKTVSYASIESFVGAKVLVEALRRAGNQPTREKVMHSLQELRSYDAGGFKVGFTPANHVGSRFVEVTVIGQGGRLLR